MITNSFRLIPVTWLHWSVCFVAKKKNPKKIKKIIKMWQKNHSKKKINYKKHQPCRLKCVCLMTSWILLDSVLATRWRLLKISFKRSRAENNALIKLFFLTQISPYLTFYYKKFMETELFWELSDGKFQFQNFRIDLSLKLRAFFSDPLNSIYNVR